MADLPARAGHGTGITAGKAVDGLVLSGVPGLVLSGVRPSCYQAYENTVKAVIARVSATPNLLTIKTLTSSKRAPFRWITVKRHHTQQQKTGFPARRATS